MKSRFRRLFFAQTGDSPPGPGRRLAPAGRGMGAPHRTRPNRLYRAFAPRRRPFPPKKSPALPATASTRPCWPSGE